VTRALLLVALALAVVPGATGADGAKTIGTRGRVAEISADGARVAIHAVLGDNPGCDAASIWTPATGKVVRLADTPCGKRQSEDEYDQLTLAGSRVVWTDYDFGNHAYCTGPYTASVTNPKPANSVKCPEAPDNQDLYWEYKGDGNLLVARSYTLCEANCAPDFSRTYDADVTIWSVGAGGLTKLLTPKDDTKLLDADAGRILLWDPTKKLLVLNAAGKQVASLAVNSKVAWLSGPGRVSVPGVAKGGVEALFTYDLATGALVETCTLAPGATMQDVENGLAVYITPGKVHLLTIATNADRVVARQQRLAYADLEPGGVFYAYNVPGGGSKPGRVTYLSLR
jgi:hypothetical protein